MNKMPIVVYTHTDMKDVWIPFFGRLKTFMPNSKIYLICNSQEHELDFIYKTVVYDDKLPYTNRLFSSLQEIQEEVVLFIHEDMILYDEPNFDLLTRYIELVKLGSVRSIKLIYAGADCSVSDIDNTLVTNEYSKFSIQPTIISVKSLIDIVGQSLGKNIWNFESDVANSKDDYMVKTGSEQKRGMYHYDSRVFPYIATAITKGKWSYSEYPIQLDSVFKEFRIDPNIRGLV